MKKIEVEAKKLLDHNGVTKPPVPVDRIAESLGAIISFEPFEGKDDLSGILYRNGKNKIIGINSAHAQNRQRFSIAHEIGHLRLHSKELFVDKVVRVNFRDNKSSLATDREEIEANTFAAELLMPKNFINTEIDSLIKKRQTLDKDELIEHLSRVFHVSPQAIEYRLINLGILISH